MKIIQQLTSTSIKTEVSIKMINVDLHISYNDLIIEYTKRYKLFNNKVLIMLVDELKFMNPYRRLPQQQLIKIKIL